MVGRTCAHCRPVSWRVRFVESNGPLCQRRVTDGEKNWSFGKADDIARCRPQVFSYAVFATTAANATTSPVTSPTP